MTLRDLLAAATPTPWTEATVRTVPDARLVLRLVNTADELLAVAEAARVVADQERPREALEADIQALRDALARLDAAQENHT